MTARSPSPAPHLLRYETLDSAQIQRIMKGEAPGEPEGWSGPGTPPGPKLPVKDTVTPQPAPIPKPAGQT